MAAKYKLLLPKTKFPLRVNPILHDPAIQKAARFDCLYKWQQEELADLSKVFTLHDGPPYANGEPHMGHVLNKVLKDIVNRYKLLRGYRINYRPGWDCHGLPIELKACKETTDLLESSPLKIRSKALQFAQKAIKLQMESFKQWGCLGDWENPYLTMDPAYEAEQISVFYKMYKRGCIYRGFKPVYWSPSSHSALAEAELEYRDHTSQAIYVLFPLTNFQTRQLSRDERTAGRGDSVHALVWTTTPWTLVANRAICYNPTHQYSLVEVQDGDNLENKLVLIGTQCISKLNDMVERFEVISTFEGSKLYGIRYYNPLLSSDTLPFLEGSHVTETEGTGLVHTAPAHGFEDYHIGVQHGLNLECNVDDQGKYTSEIGSELQGLFVLKEGNATIISQLENLRILAHQSPYSHRYPYDWRTKKPVLIRSTEQWFASVNELKEVAKTALKDVQMYPSSSINRLTSMLESREDWCISRQRVWGVPIPVFYHKHSGEALLNDETITHIKELVRQHGSNCWWKLPIEELLPTSLQSTATDYIQGTDTMDVWFDSGSSWSAVLKESDHVADMYLEGSDQHRGWFQSSLLTSVAAQGKAPYKAVVTHGFVLDEKGTKMSKSIGNVTSPKDILHSKKLGADVMRMWVAFSDYSSEVHLSDGILQQTNDFLLKIRNTCRFMLGNLTNFDSCSNLLPYSRLSKLDRYILHIMNNYIQEATQAYDSLNFSKLHTLLRHLVPRDLSTFYLDIIKDRLYCDSSTSIARRSTQTTLHHILCCFITSLAPVAPHIAEEVVQHYPFEKGGRLHMCKKYIEIDSYSALLNVYVFVFST